MSAAKVTDELVDAIEGSSEFDLIVCNYANGDMVGHTGELRSRRAGGGNPGRVPRPARGGAE